MTPSPTRITQCVPRRTIAPNLRAWTACTLTSCQRRQNPPPLHPASGPPPEQARAGSHSTAADTSTPQTQPVTAAYRSDWPGCRSVAGSRLGLERDSERRRRRRRRRHRRHQVTITALQRLRRRTTPGTRRGARSRFRRIVHRNSASIGRQISRGFPTWTPEFRRISAEFPATLPADSMPPRHGRRGGPWALAGAWQGVGAGGYQVVLDSPQVARQP